MKTNLTRFLSLVLCCHEALLIVDASPRSPEEMMQHCDGALSVQQYNELLTLSDTSTFISFLEAPDRTRRIAEVFAEAGDRRGIFASMYVEITAESTRSTVDGEYEYRDLAEGLVYQFAVRYLRPLHGYLMGEGDTIEPKWKAYYDLVEKCDSSGLYALATGVNTHLTFDLPWTLVEINSHLDFEDDFFKFGDLLVLITEASTDLLLEQQGVDADAMFNGFFVGSFLDIFFGELFTAKLLFQYVRGGAWEDFKRIRADSLLAGAANIRWSIRQFIVQFF